MRTQQRIEQSKKEATIKRAKALRLASEKSQKLNPVPDAPVVDSKEVQDAPAVAAEAAPVLTEEEVLDSTPAPAEDATVEAAPSSVNTSMRKRK